VMFVAPRSVNQRSARRDNKGIPLNSRAIDQDTPNDHNAIHQRMTDYSMRNVFGGSEQGSPLG
jgi:hypothetical protein